MHGSLMILFSTYFKQRNTSDSEIVPRPLPNILAKLVTLYLAVVRPLETLYASMRRDVLAQDYYHRLLFVSHGRMLNTSYLSREMDRIAQLENPNPCKHPVRWGQQLYRQALKAVLRLIVIPAMSDHFPPILGDADSELDHAAFGHHASIGRTRYGVDQGGLVGISLERLHNFILRASQWQAYVHVIDLPEKRPISRDLADVSRRLSHVTETLDALSVKYGALVGEMASMTRAIMSTLR